MKIALDTPVMDLLTGEQAVIEGRKTTMRHLIIKVGTNPHQEDPQKMEDASIAWTIAARAAAAPTGGSLDLNVDEASLLKTRAFGVLYVQYAGPLAAAIEEAANPAPPPPPPPPEPEYEPDLAPEVPRKVRPHTREEPEPVEF